LATLCSVALSFSVLLLVAVGLLDGGGGGVPGLGACELSGESDYCAF
jgi:hypothetical protein